MNFGTNDCIVYDWVYWLDSDIEKIRLNPTEDMVGYPTGTIWGNTEEMDK